MRRIWRASYHDIQEAVDVAHNDDTIVVGPGKYLPVSVAVDRLKIESVEGAARTIIEAEPYSGNSYSSTGGGSCFRACANYDPSYIGEGYYVDYGRQIGQGVRLDGFTLRHGFAKSNSYAMQYGGGVFGGVVSNCIIEDNYGRAAVVDAVIECSGWLRFDWKCDSASGRDRINFYVDGVGTRAMTGATDWQTVVLRVEGGQSHRFAWKLIKAKSGAADDDGRGACGTYVFVESFLGSRL